MSFGKEVNNDDLFTQLEEELNLSPKVFNPRDLGIYNQPLMVPAHEYNALKSAYLKLKNDAEFAFSSLQEFEEIVGYEVNDVFKDAWRMARTKKFKL
jgi:hypothetical protein